MASLISKIIAAVAGAAKTTDRSDSRSQLQLLVPAYFYPAGQGLIYWNQLIDAAGQVPVTAIVNPASGPGTNADPAYRTLIDRARAAGVSVLGYVASGFGVRPQALIEGDLLRYREFYEIDGYFIDEMGSDGSEASLNFYSRIYQAIKAAQPLARVIGNPGVSSHQSYLSRPCADALVVFEHNADVYQSHQSERWVSREAPERIGHLIYRVASLRLARKLLDTQVSSSAGLVYLTDDDLDNPWDTLPAWWSGLVAEIRQRNINSQHG